MKSITLKGLNVNSPGCNPGFKKLQQFVRAPKLNKVEKFLSDETAKKEIENTNQNQ